MTIGTPWYSQPDEITKQIIIEISNNISLEDRTIIGRQIFYDVDDYKNISILVGDGEIVVSKHNGIFSEDTEEYVISLCDPRSIEKVIRQTVVWYKELVYENCTEECSVGHPPRRIE